MENPLSKVLTSAPPPPPAEVKIRTMRSDIASMTRSGGGAPSFENVAVSGLSLERGTSSAGCQADANAGPVLVFDSGNAGGGNNGNSAAARGRQ